MSNTEIRKLSDLKANDKGTITGFRLPDQGVERLKSMGITVGAKVTSMRVAPFSHTLIISVEGRLYALRSETAEGILLKK